MADLTCLVTVHGIGFQQPPSDGRPGYADALHDHLREELGQRLGDDPERAGVGGPVYVQSEWNGRRELGLARLQRPLIAGGDIAHVALVYSPSEPLDPGFGSTVETAGRAVLSLGQYTSALGAMRLVAADAWAALHEHADRAARTSLQPRSDLPVSHHHGPVAALVDRLRGSTESSQPPSSLGVLRALEDDVATYVCRNDVRERVRGFVQEALLRLTGRPDVDAIVLNAHSQGTVLSWDVLCQLPWAAGGDAPAGKLRCFVTAGSPIRKYIDLFAWGEQVGWMRVLAGTGFSWHNFWDAHDPVADPLDPPASWRPGQPTDLRASDEEGLLVAVDPDTGRRTHFTVNDVRVNNIANSVGGGLQAHDYWDNEVDFVPALAALAVGRAG